MGGPWGGERVRELPSHHLLLLLSSATITAMLQSDFQLHTGTEKLEADIPVVTDDWSLYPLQI